MIRIIIERNILDGKLDDYHALIRQAKNKASNICQAFCQAKFST